MTATSPFHPGYLSLIAQGGSFQELTLSIFQDNSFISSCTFLSLSIVSLSMFSGDFRPVRLAASVWRKNFAKVRRKFETCKFFFIFFAILFFASVFCRFASRFVRRESHALPLRSPWLRGVGSSLASRKRVQR